VVEGKGEGVVKYFASLESSLADSRHRAFFFFFNSDFCELFYIEERQTQKGNLDFFGETAEDFVIIFKGNIIYIFGFLVSI